MLLENTTKTKSQINNNINIELLLYEDVRFSKLNKDKL